MGLNLLRRMGYQNDKVTSNASDSTDITLPLSAKNEQAVAELKGMQPGQTISGEIVSANGTEIRIRLKNDAVISAHLDRDMKMELGKSITFEIQNVRGNQIALRALFANTAQNPNILNALKQAELPITERNIMLTDEMMQQGMSVSKQALQSAAKIVTKFPDANMKSLVDLTRLHFPVTEANLEKYGYFQANNHDITQEMMHLTDSLASTLDKLYSDGNYKTLVQTFDQVLAELLPEVKSQAINLVNSPQIRIPGEMLQTQNPTVVLKSQSTALLQSQDEDQMLLAQLNTSEHGQVQMVPEAEIHNGLKLSESTHPDEINNVEDKLFQESKNSEMIISGIKDNQADNQTHNEVIVTADRSVPRQTDSDYRTDVLLSKEGVLSSGFQNEGNGMTLTTGKTEEFISQLQSYSIRGSDFLNTKQDEAFYRILADKVMHMFQNDNTKEKLTKTFLQKLLLKPEDLNQKNLTDQYESVRTSMIHLQSGLTELLPETASFMRGMEQLTGKQEFLLDMSHMYQYIQIPLEMGKMGTTGELHVYSGNKNSDKSDDTSVSCFLHLKMDHLGSMDVMVMMKGSSVSTKFTLESEEVLDLIANHINILDDRLLKKGYHLKNEMSVSRQSTNMIETIKNEKNGFQMSGQTELSKYSFDVRA